MLFTIIAGAFVLGAVILVHEFGHFIVAKASGVFVKTFSIGFGRKLLRRRFGQTEYALSALPFGGYVKFAGESEEDVEGAPPGDIPSKSPDEPAVESAEQPQPGAPIDSLEELPAGEIPDSQIDPETYFRNKRGLIKSAVVVAGPIMNYLLAVLLYIGVYYVQGLQVISETTIGAVQVGSAADSCGLKAGDKVLEVDGKAVSDWGEFIEELLTGWESEKTLKILRGEEVLQVGFRSRAEDGTIRLGFRPHISARVGKVKRDAPAYQAGMRKGALIEAINDTTIASYYDIERIIHANPETPLVIQWSYDGETHVDTLVPEAKKVLKEGTKTEFKIVGQIGVGPHYARKRVGIFNAVQMGATAAYTLTTEILSFLKMLFTGKAGIDSLGGPILVTQMAGDMARWGFNYLLYFLAFFSINLCIFNLLPLLPFDGGHLVLFLYEGITKRRINQRVREVLTQIGFALIILLMAIVVVVDISRCAGSSPGLF